MSGTEVLFTLTGNQMIDILKLLASTTIATILTNYFSSPTQALLYLGVTTRRSPEETNRIINKISTMNIKTRIREKVK